MEVNQSELLDVARSILAPIIERSGAVLVSGIDTLIAGPYYIMSFNPGGEPGWVSQDGLERMPTIGSSLSSLRTDYNDWADGNYGATMPSELQRRTRTVFELLGADPRRTFSTNALFVRSRSAVKLDGEWQLWWNHCWPVHQLFLAVVRPRVIVCLGNGKVGTTWEMLRRTMALPEGNTRYQNNWTENEGETAISGKWQPDVTFNLGNGNHHTCAVLGLPHPSPQNIEEWPLSEKAREKVALARCKAVGWERTTA